LWRLIAGRVRVRCVLDRGRGKEWTFCKGMKEKKWGVGSWLLESRVGKDAGLGGG